MTKTQKKRLLLTFIKLLITITVIGWIIYKYSWAKITLIVSTADKDWLLIGLMFFEISVVLGAMQWYVILKNKNVTVPFGTSLRVYFTGIFLNNIFLGYIAGGAYMVAALHFSQYKTKPSVAATFLDRLAGLLALAVFAVCGSIIVFVTNLQQGREFLRILLVLCLFSTIFLGLFLLMISQRLQDLCRKLLTFLPEMSIKKIIEELLEQTYLNRRGYKDKKMVIQVICLAFLIQLLRILPHMCAALAIGIFSVETAHFFFVIIPIIALLMLIPLPFGIREVIGGMLFSLAGFPKEKAVIMEFLATIVGITGSLIGGFTFLMDNKSNHSAPQETFDKEQ